MREIIRTKQFKKDYKKLISSDRQHAIDEFLSIITLLAADKSLPSNCRNHSLTGKWSGYNECHIKPDWLLIYKKTNSPKQLFLARTGSHSELFS